MILIACKELHWGVTQSICQKVLLIFSHAVFWSPLKFISHINLVFEKGKPSIRTILFVTQSWNEGTVVHLYSTSQITEKYSTVMCLGVVNSEPLEYFPKLKTTFKFFLLLTFLFFLFKLFNLLKPGQNRQKGMETLHSPFYLIHSIPPSR